MDLCSMMADVHVTVLLLHAYEYTVRYSGPWWWVHVDDQQDTLSYDGSRLGGLLQDTHTDLAALQDDQQAPSPKPPSPRICTRYRFTADSSRGSLGSGWQRRQWPVQSAIYTCAT